MNIYICNICIKLNFHVRAAVCVPRDVIRQTTKVSLTYLSHVEDSNVQTVSLSTLATTGDTVNQRDLSLLGLAVSPTIINKACVVKAMCQAGIIYISRAVFSLLLKSETTPRLVSTSALLMEVFLAVQMKRVEFLTYGLAPRLFATGLKRLR